MSTHPPDQYQPAKIQSVSTMFGGQQWVGCFETRPLTGQVSTFQLRNQTRFDLFDLTTLTLFSSDITT